jgi:hypothetical protein
MANYRADTDLLTSSPLFKNKTYITLFYYSGSPGASVASNSTIGPLSEEVIPATVLEKLARF